MVATNIFKNIRPDDPYPDPALELEPGPGTEVELEDDDSSESEDVEIVEDEDGGVTINYGPNEDEAPVVGHGTNLATVLDDDVLSAIGADLYALIKEDETSREDWVKTISDGLSLLGLSPEEKTEPFEGCATVVLPMLIEAVMQFQSQAYKELLPPQGPCRTIVVGKKTPEKEEQALRVKDHMNYTITEEMEEYDPDFDQMLFVLGLWGSTFKKVYLDSDLERPASPYIPPQKMIVPYTARDLLTTPRATHEIDIEHNSLRKKQVSGFYRDVELVPVTREASVVDEAQSKLTGVEVSMATPNGHTLWECHCEYDLPGFEDVDENGDATGVALPYVITLDKDTQQVLSIYRNYREADPKRRKSMYFVHYKMLPGLGFYGMGMINMLGNLAKGGTSILRQLIDSGTLANLPGGFKTKGLRVANSDEPIQPGEWRDVDAPNGDIAQALMPLPYKEPSRTLFELLGFLVGAAEKFVGTTDLGMGSNPNQEMPVGTTLALLERGQRIMSAVHKRLYYAQRQELRLIANVIRDNLSDEYPYDVEGDDPTIMRSDFDKNVNVLPVADPNIYSLTQRVAIAQEQLKMAQMAPQIHNQREAFRRMYMAIGVDNIDAILPPEQDPQPETPAAEHAKVLAVQGGSPLKAFKEQDHMMHLGAHMGFMQLPMVAQMPPVQVALTQHVLEHIHFAAKEEALRTLTQAAREQQDRVLMLQLQQDPEMKSPQLSGAVTHFENQLMGKIFGPQLQQQQPDDPLVALKTRELDIKEQSEATKKADLDRKFDLSKAEFQFETGQKLQEGQLQAAEGSNKAQQGQLQADAKSKDAFQKALDADRKYQLEQRKLKVTEEANRIRGLETFNRIQQSNKPQPAPKGAR